jgi:cytochrome P450
MWLSANHDERSFNEPDRCILDREPNRHVAFSFGPHLCLGAHVARLELRLMLEELAERMPDFRIAPGERVEWNRTGSVRGLARLPVVVGA